MDFYTIKERSIKSGVLEIFPDFKVCRSKDLMIRGGRFYAIWDEKLGLWSTDEYDVQRLVDDDLREYYEKIKDRVQDKIKVRFMGDFSSKIWSEFRNYISHVSDNSHQLDETLTFSNTEVKKKDYVSKKLSYSLEEGKCESYEELISTLYDPVEREKLEWAIGAIVSGDSKDIQKFIVLYGPPGGGKGTVLNIVQKLFDGYTTAFESKTVTSANNSFALEVFRHNPLVAIDPDGDLSRIEDNTRLNSVVSHENMNINEKYKSGYTSRINCMLFIGTNKPVKITDAKSGIIRRLIDIKPSGRSLPPKKYQTLMAQINFELGAIAYQCLQKYRSMGRDYYLLYRPIDMMYQTDVFFNFVESNFHIFKEQDSCTLSQAYEIYKQYCDETLIDFKLPRYKFREELKNYFKDFSDIARVDGSQIRSYYSGFLIDKFISKANSEKKDEELYSLILDSTQSIFDEYCSDFPAQYANEKETPVYAWNNVQTKLSDIDTTKVHYVKFPENHKNHIVIDFDLKDEYGNKSMERNMEAASKWPPTYAEFSKGGSGIHLHYIYNGDVKKLDRTFDKDIEIKIFTGKSSLRRKLSKCNRIPIAEISSGLPLKEEKMINFDTVKSERRLRELIKRNLNKEIHPGTKPSIDFINKLLEDAYNSGLHFDLTDMRPQILAFANNSTHQSEYCLKLVSQMKFKSEEISKPTNNYNSDKLVIFDVEVFPNLFLIVWKYKGKENKCVRMYNPSPQDIEQLFKFKLVGFNCRRYDNHILYAAYIGYNNQQLYELSQKIINDSKNCLFGEAYYISYTDVYDFLSAGNKMSLKKWEIKLGIKHNENEFPWDKPVPKEKWEEVGDYCSDDVIATEAIFDANQGDWAVRQILAELSGLTVNDTTNQHTIRIVFGDKRDTKNDLVYTDLSIMFPGYKFENGKSTYRGVEVGEGGFVYAEPGMYSNVPVLDVASMHPTSTEELNLLGPYTKNYSDLKKARLAIKHKDFDKLSKLLNGKLIPFVENAISDNPRFTLKDVSNGLKTAINSAYGLTSASFDNPFKDPRNIDNIVAKRGALFMIDLMYAVQEKGFTVAHIKTDSIKIPHATPEIIQFVMDFGKKYGYDFEHECTYDRFCLVNDAVYIARVGWTPDGKGIGEWSATGAQFAHPYLFKTLFSKEQIEFKDLCETKSVSSAMYLDMNEYLSENEHNYKFIGKVGLFCPVKAGCSGGVLLREKDGKYYAVGGTKGYRWLESEVVKRLGKENDIDMSYFHSIVNAAISDISKYGDFEWFVSNELDDKAPWE